VDIDKALNKFLEYKVGFEEIKTENLSETDTRCKILDKIFIEILGWDESHIKREEYMHKVGYYDYMISTGVFHFVAEAKKQFVSLKLPNSKKVKIKTLLTDTINEDCISQIRNYLVEKGLNIGIISNGNQFIIAQFVNVDGTDWKNNEAILFDGFDEIERRFIDFYNLLSYKEVFRKGRIEIRKEVKFAKKLIGLPNLRRKNDKLIRNDLSDKLIKIIDLIFREIVSTSELDNITELEKCYVLNEDVEKHHSEMSVMFQDSPPIFDESIKGVRNTRNTQKSIEKTLLDSNYNLPSPIVLIGGKGAGKTTFINYFFKVSMSADTKKKIPSVYIDFREFNDSQISRPSTIYQYILSKLYLEHGELKLEDYNIIKRIYKKEIKQKSERGLWSIFKNDPEKLELKINEFLADKIANPEIHLQAVSKYLINPGHKRLCIIFDNVDQLDFGIQEKAFLLSQSIHLSLQCLVIISLREGYYYQWRNKPPFDAYQPNVFHITAPSYREVLKKRIQYVIDNFAYSNTEGNIGNKTFKLSDETQEDFFKSLYKTLFLNKNSELLEFLEQTSYPNIRLGLDKFNSFLISGHTQVETYMTSSTYNIPIWEFVKSIALESNYYYQESKSKVFNLFSPSPNSTNHFLKIRILYYLLNEAESLSYKEYYTPTKKLLNLFVECGYNKDIVLEELTILLENGMINSESYYADVQELNLDLTEFQITITQCGMYYVQRLITEFFYIDLIIQDTVIYNEEKFSVLKNYFRSPDDKGKRPLDLRIKLAHTFVEYLKEVEDAEKVFMVNIENRALSMNIVDYMLETRLSSRLKLLRNRVIGNFNVKDARKL